LLLYRVPRFAFRGSMGMNRANHQWAQFA
jgi:hypothetical protein